MPVRLRDAPPVPPTMPEQCVLCAKVSSLATGGAVDDLAVVARGHGGVGAQLVYSAEHAGLVQVVVEAVVVGHRSHQWARLQGGDLCGREHGRGREPVSSENRRASAAKSAPGAGGFHRGSVGLETLGLFELGGEEDVLASDAFRLLEVGGGVGVVVGADLVVGGVAQDVVTVAHTVEAVLRDVLPVASFAATELDELFSSVSSYPSIGFLQDEDALGQFIEDGRRLVSELGGVEAEGFAVVFERGMAWPLTVAAASAGRFGSISPPRAAHAYTPPPTASFI